MALDDAYPTGTTDLETTAQWEAFLDGYGPDGVVAGVALEMAPYFDVGTRTAGVAPGAAQIRGVHVDGPTHTSKPIPTPDAQNRIDRVVLRLDRAASTAADWITLQVLTGTPGSSPAPPALTQTPDGVYELPMARWTAEADGSLTNFADERIIAAASPVEFNPWARPAPSPRRLGLERYTNKLLYADGTVWRTVWEDTGWAPLAMNGPDGGAWSANSICRVRRVGDTVRLRIAVQRWDLSALRVGDADGSRVISLDTQFRPSAQEPGFGVRGASPVHLRVDPDGIVRIFPLVDDIPAGTTVFAGVTYLAG